eukprot:471293-Hanusia_phi.AAC.3
METETETDTDAIDLVKSFHKGTTPKQCASGRARMKIIKIMSAKRVAGIHGLHNYDGLCSQFAAERRPDAECRPSKNMRYGFIGLVVCIALAATGPTSLAESGTGGLVRVQSGTPIVLNRASKAKEKQVLGAMGTLESKLRNLEQSTSFKMPRSSDLKVAKGEVLKLYPISGTGVENIAVSLHGLMGIVGAQHVNPINGRCLYGKDKSENDLCAMILLSSRVCAGTGECRLYPYPRYTMEGKLNLPPPRGPPDENGYRSSPPVKFPKALVSVAGEIERKSGDLSFQEKVKEEMHHNEAIMEALQKHILKQESTISEQQADLQMIKDEVKLAKDRISTELENFKEGIKDKIKKKESQVHSSVGDLLFSSKHASLRLALKALRDLAVLREWTASQEGRHLLSLLLSS